MAEKKSDGSRPQSAQGALLLMPASDTDSTALSSNLLVPYVQSDTSALFPDDDAEADSFIGQTAVLDDFKPQQFNYFANSTSHDTADPFHQIQQPELLPSSQPVQLNKPSPLPQFGLDVGQLQTNSSASVASANVNPYAAGAAIVSGRSGHHAPPESNLAMGQRMQPANQVLQQAVPVQQPLQSVLLPVSAPSATNALYGAPPGAPTTVIMPAMQSPTSIQTFGSNRPLTAGQSDVTALPSSIYAPIASPSNASQGSQIVYQAVAHHWFYSQIRDSKELWEPFSVADSLKLDEIFKSGGKYTVPVQGGRYDVNVASRRRFAVYYYEESRVRRCSWFYRPDGENMFVPFDEHFAAGLEESYKNTLYSNDYHRRLIFSGGESIVIHSPQTVIYFSAASQPDAWGNTVNDSRPSAVRRGISEFENIPDDESDRIDHLVLFVDGPGTTCDLRLRNIVECVDDFRSTSCQIMKSHFQQATSESRVGRVEFLPVRWHEALNGNMTGVDRQLKKTTLNSIKKLRSFTNDTLLEILFYGSPAYAQAIVDTVGNEINRLVQLFLARNPAFRGGISVSGHSLGALVCFDLLINQKSDAKSADIATLENNLRQLSTVPAKITEAKVDEAEVDAENHSETETLDSVLNQLGLASFVDQFRKEQIDLDALSLCDDNDMKEMGLPLGPRKKLLSFLRDYKEKQMRRKAAAEHQAKAKDDRSKVQVEKTAAAAYRDPLLPTSNSITVSYIVGNGGIGSPALSYPQMSFKPANFFALGSPIALFLALRGIDSLGEDFHLPTCAGFFNIFHPFDPLAYRLEPMIVQSCPLKPILIPHHKGRKRLHLELKESLTRMGSDLKQRIIESVKATWRSLHSFAQAHKSGPVQDDVVEKEVDDVITEMTIKSDDDETSASIASSVADEDELPMSSINQGRRVDFVLQEKPIEIFNDYLFALGSQTCYWQSEDTALLMLKEIYSPLGVCPLKPSAGGMFQLQSPVTTFPRVVAGPPPRAGFVPVPASHVPYGATPTPAGPSQASRLPYGAAVNSTPVVPVAAVRPNFAGSSSAATPPSATFASPTGSAVNVRSPPMLQPVGPPPMSGFVKK